MSMTTGPLVGAATRPGASRDLSPLPIRRVFGEHLYTTEGARLLARDADADGCPLERPGRCTYLFRARDVAYFAEHRTAWRIEADALEPLSAEAARALFDALPARLADPGDAFAGAATRVVADW